MADEDTTGPERPFELKLATGRVVQWNGATGEDAARRYVDVYRDATVVASRPVRHGLFVGAPTEG